MRWRTGDFREARNSKASTWSNVEKELAKPAGAAAAYRFLHKPKKLGQTTSDMETDALLEKEDITHAFSQAEAGKEEIAEANTEVIERIKMGSDKICIRNDMTKKNVMFNQDSFQAIFEMGSVELIELKKSRVQCPSCPAFFVHLSHQNSRGYKHGPTLVAKASSQSEGCELPQERMAEPL